MFGIFKFILRLGVILGIMVLGAAIFAGPDRVEAVFHQVQSTVAGVIDDNIDDPVALRSQLRKLEKQYPERIAQVRSDLAELQAQIHELEEELAVSERVVDMTDSDLDALQSKVDGAKSEASQLSGTNTALASIRARGSAIEAGQAFNRMQGIFQTRQAFAARAEDARRDLGYLNQQRDRLVELAAKLEAEHTQFKAQIWQLDRQVDAVARNERLIEILEKRQKTIEDLGRYKVDSLDHLHARLNEIRTRQEAKLEVLSTDQQRFNYEERARMELEMERTGDGPAWKTEVRFSVPADPVPYDTSTGTWY